MQRRSIFQRAGDAFKAFVNTVTSISHHGWSSGAGNSWILLPGTQTDWGKKAGPLWLNGVVSVCLRWVLDNYPEPDLQVVTKDSDGNFVPIEGHPLVELLRRPNPEYDGDTLWAATALSYLIDGNAYWFKARGSNGLGAVRELWWLPHWQLEPWAPPGSLVTTHYKYQAGGSTQFIEREKIVHFRYGIDPNRPRKGWSRLLAVLREICGDNEASTYAVALLENMGIPGVLISPKEGKFTPEQKTALVELFKSKTKGDKRGEPLGSTIPVEMAQLGFSPDDMALDTLHDRPEDRICGAIGIPPQVVGLSSGAKHKTYTNYPEARRAAYHDCLIPMQSRFTATVENSLGPDFDLPAEHLVRYSYEHISVLQEDKNERHKREREDFRAGLTTKNEARLATGRKAVEGGDTYYEPRPALPPGKGDGKNGQGQGDPGEDDGKKRLPLLSKLRQLRPGPTPAALPSGAEPTE